MDAMEPKSFDEVCTAIAVVRREDRVCDCHGSLHRCLLLCYLSIVLVWCGALRGCRGTQGAVIIRQGDVGDFFYVVERGFCDIFVDGVGKVGRGALNGKLTRACGSWCAYPRLTRRLCCFGGAVAVVQV